MTKKELRNCYKNKRANINTQEKAKLSDLLLINFQKVHLPFISCVHSYLSIPGQNEVDTWPIIRYLKFCNPGLQVCIPKINIETGQMEHYIYEEDTRLKKNKFGIEEPESGERLDPAYIDVAITPLLAFDKKGNRVGFGKGFYDRFFLQCRSDIIKIGLSFFEAEDIIEGANQYDIPLDYCVTPQTIYHF